MRAPDDILAPPSPRDVERAIALFATAARAAYGERLVGLYLFGSRARADHHPFSDVDIAVVLADGEVRLVPEKRRLADLTHDIILETGVEVQPWPIARAAWDNPDRQANAALVKSMRRDARRIEA